MTYWSVELHRAKLKLSVWCQIWSCLCRQLPIDTILRQAQQWDIIDPSGCTLATADVAINTLKLLVRQIHKASHEKRQEYLLATANLNEDADATQKAHALHQMMRAESRLEAYQRLGYARGKHNKQQAINKILVPMSWPTQET